MKDIDTLVRQTLRDIEVELTDAFDRNFATESFFGSAWERRHSPLRQGGHLLVDTGHLRQSITSRISGRSIVFESSLPYSAIHNEGGEIVVTERMKRYFWHRYYAARGSFGRRKDGSARKDKRTLRLTTEAEFWKCMALMKTGKTIRIPRRQFMGRSPEVERAVREIMEENLAEYFKVDFKNR